MTVSPAATARPRIAIVHDFLTVKGGAERVALALSEAFEDAPLYTALYQPSATFAEFGNLDVRPSALNQVRRFRDDHRLALPLIPGVFRSMTIDADVVICSSAGFSHHVRTTGRKVVYCHTPARWLHDTDRYVAGWGPIVKTAVSLLRPVLAPLDYAAMSEAAMIIANSAEIAAEIRSVYRADATVIPPCSSLRIAGPAEPIDGIEPGFVLCPSRALGYKRLDVLVEAAQRLPEMQFVHVGGGPHRSMMNDGPPNVVSVGPVDDAKLRWAYRNARTVAITSAEDFGLVPLEANAHGLAAVVPRARGLINNAAVTECGIFYDFGSPHSLASAIRKTTTPASRQLHPERLGAEAFVDAISAELAETTR